MGFLSEFAEGFFTTSANTVLKRKELQDEVDVDKKKRLNELDVNKEMESYRAKLKEEAEIRARERLLKERQSDLYGFASPDATVNPTEVSTPAGTDPAQMEQLFTSGAANAYMRGDTDAAQSYRARADVFKTQREVTKEKRQTGREPTLDVSGSPVAGDYAKQENERLAKGQSTKFLPKRTSMTGNNPEVEEARRLEAESSGLAQSIVSKISQETSDETGVSRLSAPKVINIAEKLVMLRNKLNIPGQSEDATTKDLLVLNETIQELNSYSDGLGTDVYTELFPEQTGEESAEPVELIGTQEADPYEGRTIINKQTGERMIRRNGTWQKL